jgi:uncharacterized protein (TIGR02001 family)
VALTTDYVMRGISQTQHDGAVQADLHVTGTAGGYAGAWASTLDPDFDELGQVEVDLYAGWNWQLAPDWTARVGYVRYLYPDASGGIDYDYGELGGRLAWRDRVVGTVGWSPDMLRFTGGGYARRADGYAFELAARQPVDERWSLTAGVGRYLQPADIEYWSWNAGINCRCWRALELDLSHFANDSSGREYFGREAAGDRWSLTALWHF